MEPSLIDEALKTATEIAAMPPLAAIANKEMVNAAFETTLDQGLLMERRIFQVLTATEDKAEGMADSPLLGEFYELGLGVPNSVPYAIVAKSNTLAS